MAMGAKAWIFEYTGENLIYKIRIMLFESLLHKEISWFDARDRAPGVIASVLSEDISNLSGLTT